jgi:hypothetical protein
MFDFVCENGHKTERFVDYEATNLKCMCGATANRALSAPAFRLEGWSGAFPTAHSKFGKSHTDKLKSERKLNS